MKYWFELEPFPKEPQQTFSYFISYRVICKIWSDSKPIVALLKLNSMKTCLKLWCAISFFQLYITNCIVPLFPGLISPGVSVPVQVPGSEADMSQYWSRLQWYSSHGSHFYLRDCCNRTGCDIKDQPIPVSQLNMRNLFLTEKAFSAGDEAEKWLLLVIVFKHSNRILKNRPIGGL